MTTILANRQEAGRLLSLRLANYYQQPDVIVLGLPRGGVPVAAAIASNLLLPLDICLVRKLGVPSHRELAMGAIATGGITILNRGIIESCQVTPKMIEEVKTRELEELHRREQLYRGDRPYPQLEQQKVILVDDGIATGATIQAAITSIKHQQPQEIIIATPIICNTIFSQLQPKVDNIICLIKPPYLDSISSWYNDFTQVTDAEVCYLLSQLS
jgi:putative phosphoribosyl transferase